MKRWMQQLTSYATLAAVIVVRVGLSIEFYTARLAHEETKVELGEPVAYPDTRWIPGSNAADTNPDGTMNYEQARKWIASRRPYPYPSGTDSIAIGQPVLADGIDTTGSSGTGSIAIGTRPDLYSD